MPLYNSQFICWLALYLTTKTYFVTSRSMTLFSSHSLNLATHSARSPLVSYLGYAIATTSIFGRAWLMRARRCSGKVPNVLSSPCRYIISSLSLHRLLSHAGGMGSPIQQKGAIHTLKPCMNTNNSVLRMLTNTFEKPGHCQLTQHIEIGPRW